MSGPGPYQTPHAYQQPPAPYPPQQPAPPGQPPGHPAHPQGGWIDSTGRWQPGSPPRPPKKSSNGVVIALCIVAGVLAVVLLGALGRSVDSSPSPEEEALSELSERLDEADTASDRLDDLMDGFASDNAAGLSDEEGDCVTAEIVDEFGAARALEISAADVDAGLPRAEAEALADAYVECVDLRAFFARSLDADPATAGLPDFYVDCLFDEVGAETFRTQFADAFAGSTASDSELEQLGAEAGDRCIASFTPEQLDELAAS